MNILKYILSFFILLSILLTTVRSQEDKVELNKVSIIGIVRNSTTQKPIPGITVKVESTQSGAITKSDGSFVIKGLSPGTYAVKFSGVAYNQFIQSNIIVSNVKPAQLEINLVEKTIELKGVEVRGSFFLKRAETVTSSQSLSAEEIRRAPGVNEDVIQATSLLPGVAVSAPGRNDMVVRGGAPFENLFVVDNIELPNINHFGSQGSSGGPLALVNIDFVNNVNFSAGGFGSKYGDKLSSITNITLRNGNEDRFGGKAILSATGFSFNVEGPISDKGSYILSARRSYLDLIFKAAGLGFIPQYWDFMAKVNYKLDVDNSLTFLSIVALDNVYLNNSNLDNQYKNSQVAVPDQKQYFAGLTWKHLFLTGFSNVTIGRSFTDYRTFQNDSNKQTIFKNYSIEGENTLKADFEFQLAKNWLVDFGSQFKYASQLKYDVLIPGFLRTDQFSVPQPLQVDSSINTLKNATFVSLTSTIGQHKVTFGGRLDYYSFTQDKFFFSPRISAIYQINPVSAVIMSAGRYYQSPSYIWLIGAPGQKLNPMTADQAVLGYEHTPMEDLKVQLEGYYKIYSNYDARIFRPQAVLTPGGFEDIYSDIPFGLEPVNNSAKGWSRGVELFIQKKWRPDFPLYGLLSISYSRSMFTSIEGKERLSAYDSPLIFNLALGYRFENNWEIGFKYRTAIGSPTTPYLPTGVQDYTQYNEGERLPIFHQTDFRVDKRFDLGNFSLDAYIDIQNIFNTKNISGGRWDFRTQSVVYNKSFGILPSIGIQFEF